MKKLFLLTLMLLMCVVTAHAEPVTSIIWMKSHVTVKVKDGLMSTRTKSEREISLENGVMRDMITEVNDPGSEYACVIKIIDYVMIGHDWYSSSNQVEIFVRGIRRGGGIIGWTNNVPGNYEMSPPGGNSSVTIKSGDTVSTAINSTRYKIDGSQEDSPWKSFFTFFINGGNNTTLRGPNVPANGTVEYMPSFEDASRNAKRKVTRLSLSNVEFQRWLASLTNAKRKVIQ